MYARSPTAYKALRTFGIQQLSSVLTLKMFTAFNYEKPGFSEERLRYARRQYEMVKGTRPADQTIPFSEGIRIFDEVKVGLKLHYRAKQASSLILQRHRMKWAHSMTSIRPFSPTTAHRRRRMCCSVCGIALPPPSTTSGRITAAKEG